MMDLRLNDASRRAELREMIEDMQREGWPDGNYAARWDALFGEPSPDDEDVILALLDEVDRMEAER